MNYIILIIIISSSSQYSMKKDSFCSKSENLVDIENGSPLMVFGIWEEIVRLREREGQRVDLGRSLKGQKSQRSRLRSRIKLFMDQVR